MKRLFTLALFVLGAVALTFAQGGNVLVIRNVTLIDGTGRAPVAKIRGLTIAPLRSFARSPMMYSGRLPASNTVVTPA